MKRLIWILLLLVLRVPTSEARPLKEPRTVLDYFYLLPNRFFEIENPNSWSNRRKWLYGGFKPGIPAFNRSIIDVKNDYLRSPGDGAQSDLYLAVFRYHGQTTLGVYTGWDAGELSFWRFQKGGLKEVTEQVLPKKWRRTLDTFDYLMPRVGTSIRVFRWNPHIFERNSAMKPLYLLEWQAGRLQAKANKNP